MRRGDVSDQPAQLLHEFVLPLEQIESLPLEFVAVLELHEEPLQHDHEHFLHGDGVVRGLVLGVEVPVEVVGQAVVLGADFDEKRGQIDFARDSRLQIERDFSRRRFRSAGK